MSSESKPLSRRDFLKTGAVTAGAVALSAQTRARAQGANSRIRMGFIGCGSIANEHLSKLMQMRESDNVEIDIVCDVYRKRAEDFQRKIGREQARPLVETDYRKVLDRRDLDYVLIATPEHSHAYLIMDALDAGKHVYAEKPMTHTIEEAQAVLKKLEGTNLKLQVGVQGMADDSYSSANRAIREGLLGSVVQAQIDYVRNYKDQGPWRRGGNPDAEKPDDLQWESWLRPAQQRPWEASRYYEWRCFREYSGGVATDLFIHRITRLIKACGLSFPERVAGMGGIYTWPDGRDLPDSFEMLCEYPAVEGITNGMTLHVLGTMANEHGNDHCIRGTEATLYFTRTGWEIKADGTSDVIATHTKTGAEDVYPHHVNHHAAIRDGAELYCPPELGLYGVVACAMANKSWFDKCTMVWDKEKGQAVKA